MKMILLYDKIDQKFVDIPPDKLEGPFYPAGCVEERRLTELTGLVSELVAEGGYTRCIGKTSLDTGYFGKPEDHELQRLPDGLTLFSPVIPGLFHHNTREPEYGFGMASANRAEDIPHSFKAGPDILHTELEEPARAILGQQRCESDVLILFPHEAGHGGGDLGLGQPAEIHRLAPRDYRWEERVPVGCDQDQHRVTGRFFESLQETVLGFGREFVGIPKLYADISPIRILSNRNLRCDISLWGHLLFGIDLEPLEKQNADVCNAASERATQRPRFGYKYIPSFDGPPDANYPTVFWTDVTIEQLWIGKSAELYFGNQSEKDIGGIKPVVDALKSLPVRSITQTIHSRGSQVLRYDKCRGLR